MLEAFIWMFKKDEFKKHFLYLSVMLVITIAIASAFFLLNLSRLSDIIITVSALFLLVFFLLSFLGYFWNLTEHIIDRDVEIISNEIYDGKIKKIFHFALPEFNLTKLAWRGLASIVASLVFLIPYFELLYLGFQSGSLTQSTYSSLIFLNLFYFAFAPALFWNYAKQNSIFAVLDFRKAVYIMGNFFFKYFGVIIFYVFIFIINELFDSVVLVSIKSLFSSQIFMVPVIILLSIIIGLKNIYMIFVNAYILGTLVPETES